MTQAVTLKRARNTKNGIRSKQKIEERRIKRTYKKREARRKNRAERQANKPESKKKANSASAQEPLKRIKIELGKEIHIATLNIRGTNKLGKREEVEEWMKSKNISILALQETKSPHSKRETRKDYTWYFSGNGKEKCHHGVGLVIRSDLAKHIEDIEPINERLMYMTIDGTIPINIIVAYMPTSIENTETKDKAYENLQNTYDKLKNTGPTYIMGDFNARLIYPNNSTEEESIGKFTTFDNNDYLSHSNYKEGMLENRELLMQFSMSNELKITNTTLQKNIGKLATYRIVKNNEETTYEEINNRTHAQIDFVIVSHRWRNSITDIESDTRANLNSDHFPLYFTIRVRLKQAKKGGKTRPQYKQCDGTQQDDLNYELWNTIPEEQNDDNRYKVIKDWLRQGIDTLPKTHLKDKNKRYELSNNSKDILEKRKQAAKNRNIKEFLTLNRQFTKSRREDKKQRIIESVSKELDLRDRWIGIRELKRKYNPTPFHNKNAEGEHINHKRRAQEAAKHLSEKQWGTNNEEVLQEQNETPIIEQNTEQYNIDYPTLVEIYRAIKKLKRRKAPGPDDIPTELLKELKEDNVKEIQKLFKQWWEHENIDTEELKARVVLIYKKGDTNKFENYRPISLLNTLYKLFAAIIQKRISNKLDKHLQKTQFGFRADKATGDAIHLIRRIIEFGESTKNNLYLVLLDWEKAFDKVDRNQLFNSMKRMGVDPKLINITKSIYRETVFCVELDGYTSEWLPQNTGIRQGCPLSPYLFLIVMTTLFHDVHHKLDSELKKHRVPGADFDEVTYADDTICISRCIKTMNEFIKTIEEEGAKYGMKLNKAKCELLTNNPNARIIFPDNSLIKKHKSATYLGCELGLRTTNREEISKRFAATMAIMKKLDIFWRHSDCPTHIKVYTADAVLRSKLLYGLESAQLIPSVLKKLETFQLKVLRKILKIDTTYINRVNSNASIFNRINTTMETEGKSKRVISFVEAYNKIKRKRAIKIINQENTSIYNVSFENGKFRKWTHKNRRVGRPRMNWTEETINEIWNIVKRNNDRYRYTQFDEDNMEMINLIKEHTEE